SNFRINKVAYHPRVPNLVFVTASDGLYRSTDNLNTWTKVTNGSISQIDFHPTDNNIIYILDYYYWNFNRDKVFRSLDQGVTFTASATISGNAGSGGYFSVSPECDDCMYFASTNGVWISKDTAKTFTFLSNPPQSCLGFAVNDQDTSKMVYGYVDVETSKDGGRNFKQVSWWSLGNANHGTGSFQDKLANSGKYIHADLHPALAIHGTFYVGTDGFFCKSSDNGETWKILSQGVGIRDNYCVGASQSNSFRSITGSQDNGTSIKHRSTWIEFNGGDGMEGIIHPLNDDWMIGSYQYGSRFRTKNGGLSSSGVTPPGQGGSGNGAWVAPLAYDPNNHMHIYNFSASVFKSTNFGSSWDSIGKPSFGGLITEAAIAENNSKIIIVSRGGFIEKSTDGGVTFSSIKAKHATDTLPSYTIKDIAFDPQNDKNIVVTYNRYNNDGKKVFLTTDGGNKWTNITYNLGNMPINGAVIDHSSSRNIYVAAEIGVYVKAFFGTTWTLYSTGLPNSSINELEVVNGSNTLKAAVWGRGLWEYTLKDRGSYPSIISTKINDMPTDDLPKKTVTQFVTSVVSYLGKLSSASVKWSINSLKFDSIITMTNISDSTWVTDSPLPEGKAGDLVYFKVYADGGSGKISETYKFMYEVLPFEHCAASGDGNPNPYLNSMSIANISNTSTQDQYSYYPDDVVYLMKDSTYTINLKANTSWTSNDFGAWIDYNRNAVFDANDSLGFSSSGNSYSKQFTVPTDAVTDDTLMLRTRVSYWGNQAKPCGTTLGEVEDYPVIVFGPPALNYSFADSSLCSGDVLDYSYVGDEVDLIRWTFTSGSNEYISNTKNGTLTNLPNGSYHVKLECYKHGYYFKRSFFNVFEKNDTNEVLINLTSCNPADTGWVVQNLYNVAGCDSTVRTNTTLLESFQLSINQTSCDPQDTGVIVDKYMAVNGCDSIVTITTTLLKTASTAIKVNTCSPLDSGVFIDTYQSVNGCDSTVTTTRTYVGFKASIDAQTNILKANPAGMNYQWLDCGNNLSEIAGQTQQEFNFTKDGNYAVSVTSNECIDTSACEAVFYVGIVRNTFSDEIKLSPNPTKGKINIAFGKVHNKIELRMNDELGKVVYADVRLNSQHILVDISTFTSGIYYLTISENDEKITYKIIKQ
ncbi:GEVED domain-containing protein, partial [Bacteroidia bacterium]|nr:GEVED domain-containing protein [Bacteroidia bacterium]